MHKYFSLIIFPITLLAACRQNENNFSSQFVEQKSIVQNNKKPTQSVTKKNYNQTKDNVKISQTTIVNSESSNAINIVSKNYNNSHTVIQQTAITNGKNSKAINSTGSITVD